MLISDIEGNSQFIIDILLFEFFEIKSEKKEHTHTTKQI